MSALPEFPQGFTPEFLTRVLGDKLRPGAKITHVSQGAMGEGTGMMAEIARLELTYDGDQSGSPASLIAKYASQNPTNREVALGFNLYERESRYFAELDPLTDAQSPEVYFTALEGDNFVILMEDMSDYEVGNQIIGATLEQTELAVDELAKLHGTFWENVEGLDWVPGIAHSYHADNMLNFATNGWDTMVASFGEYIPEHVRQKKDQFLKAIPALQDRMFERPITITHGDYRMENLLYGRTPDQHPIAVIDWQGPLQSHGMFDVALFIGQSTKIEVRQEHERALLDRYREGLERKGVTGLTREGVWDDYRNTMLYDWVYTTVVAGTLDAENDTGVQWMSQMVARQVAASDDLDVFDLLP